MARQTELLNLLV
jgi:hypothetical protein